MRIRIQLPNVMRIRKQSTGAIYTPCNPRYAWRCRWRSAPWSPPCTPPWTRSWTSSPLCTAANHIIKSVTEKGKMWLCCLRSSVAIPDPYVFWPPRSGSGSISTRYGSGSGSGPFKHQAKMVRKNLDSYCLVTSLWLFIFEKWRKCSFKK